MKPSLFLSYCRREAPFTDSLLDALEDGGFQVWMDYHSLVPGQPWDQQIQKGIIEAEIVLLVVSKEALKSPYVAGEWQEAIKLQKRIVLVIFEAVALPAQLQQREWVDFRSSFKEGVKALEALLETPALLKQPDPPPQKGFKAPRVVWISFIASVIVALISLPAFWTVYVPWYLLPLPYRILKRDFNFFHVHTILWMLPLILLMSAVFLEPRTDVEASGWFVWSFAASLLFGPILLFLLRSRGLQRWGKPIASRPQFANPHNPNIKDPKPVSFSVDYAPEDKKYADDIIAALKKYGHPYVEVGQKVEAALVLISAFKNSTPYDPETCAVYPVLIQANPKIDDKLKRIQWIDFRQGLRKLEVLPQLLPDPLKLLKALGITPNSQQTVLPPVIQALVYFLTLLAIFSVGGWFVAFFQLAELPALDNVICSAPIAMGLFLGLIFFMTRALIYRKGRLASFRNFMLALAGLGGLALYQFVLTSLAMNMEDQADMRGMAGAVSGLVYFVGVIIIVLLMVWYRQDLRRWFPQRSQAAEVPAQQPQAAR
jgi:hypothetical protein